MFFAPIVRTRSAAPAFRSFDRSFERFINEALVTPQRQVNVEQDDKAWTVTLDVPGLARDDLSIGIEGPVVRIESRAEAKRQIKAAYELPQDIDASASSAKLENGVLILTLAKLAPASKVTPLAIS
ncbi:MAG: Hsp20/alpha crystallin family protein [Ramlibacter sp.]|nr:Hsp20/alpha crystallin family protein [Ramlibacter sp.]